MRTVDDLRGAKNSSAVINVVFTRGEQIAANLAGSGEWISSGLRRWRFPAQLPLYPEQRPYNAVKFVSLSYALDPGDGAFLQRDTWSFDGLKMTHYCSGAAGAPDWFMAGTPPERVYRNNEIPIADAALRTLKGRNILKLYEDAEFACRKSELRFSCSDGLACNGLETCDPGKRSDVYGCVPGRPTVCSGNLGCFEPLGTPRTVFGCFPRSCSDPDKDRDGVAAVGCGGTDCNDTDRTISPGRGELWDPENKDEDCNPATNGASDHFAGLRQVCDGANNVIVIGGGGIRDRLDRIACSGGSVCVSQPSGEGVCTARPDGYTPPPLFSVPLQQKSNASATRLNVDRVPRTFNGNL